MLKRDKSGFTLMELLLVITIIGILAGVIVVGMKSGRERARVAAALRTAESVTAELAYCYFNDKHIDGWHSQQDGGYHICSGAGEWPSLRSSRCIYFSYNRTTNVLNIRCNNGNTEIFCTVADSRCEVVSH